jgi:hypothetical protein
MRSSIKIIKAISLQKVLTHEIFHLISFRIDIKNCEVIRNSRCITGVNINGRRLAPGILDTGDKLTIGANVTSLPRIKLAGW